MTVSSFDSVKFYNVGWKFCYYSFLTQSYTMSCITKTTYIVETENNLQNEYYGIRILCDMMSNLLKPR